MSPDVLLADEIGKEFWRIPLREIAHCGPIRGGAVWLAFDFSGLPPRATDVGPIRDEVSGDQSELFGERKSSKFDSTVRALFLTGI